MSEERVKCINTGKDISVTKNNVIFKCPDCGKGTIVRSGFARQQSLEYTCPVCGFVGP